MIHLLPRSAAALVFCVAAQYAHAKVVEDVITLPVEVTNIYGKAVGHDITVTVFHDDQRSKAAFMVLNHGRASNDADRFKVGRARYTDNAKYFVAMGFAVFVPTRVGYGVTGGEDIEYSGPCLNRNYPPVYEAAARQTLRVIEYAKSLPYVDADRGLVVGQSFGGMTAITVAAKNVPGVLAAVNFAGGGGGDPLGHPQKPCSERQLTNLFASYGATSRIPTLWLYSENDQYFGVEKPKRWFEAFRSKGAAGQFVRLPPLPANLGHDGHATFTRNSSAWRAVFEEFLVSLGLQAR
jgi:dienelactone hydrolase